MDEQTIRNINRTLADNYGRDALGRPMFKLVDVEKEVEKRTSIFPHYAGDIYIGEGPATKILPKYNFLGPGYVLEANVEFLRKIAELRGKSLVYDLMDEAFGVKSADFEILWYFDATKTEPTLTHCEILLRQVMYGKKITKADIDEMEEQEKRDYINFCIEVLNTIRPYERVMSELGERVYPAVNVMPGTEIGEK